MPVAGFQQLSVLSSVASSLTVPAGARKAVVTCYTQAVRYRLDGTAPTTTAGVVLPVSTVLEITDFGGLNDAKFIALTGTAELNVHYYS